MTFHSILFQRVEDSLKQENSEAPTFLIDLNLDQIIDTITASKQEYNLKPFFYIPLTDIRAIHYRHEVMQDLENQVLFKNIKSFAQRMRTMRDRLAQAEKLYYKYQKESWFLDAVEIYCEAVNCLADDLSHIDLKSRGFLAFRKYLTDYSHSDQFMTLCSEVKTLRADLATVQYNLLIKGNTVKVRKYEGEIDYSAEVLKTFDKFKQGAVKDYRVKFNEWLDMNHVEAKVLDMVAQLYSDIFIHLDQFCAENRNYLNETIGVFDREIQFYIAYLEYIATLKQAGLNFCYPKISNPSKEVYNYEGFDLALAYKLNMEHSAVICNDFYLKGNERIIIVSGPNQGGKTTFARAFGQLHYLASLGCPVPGRKAQLFLFDQLFTHFEKEETINNLRGKLEDDLIRINEILNQATPNSIIILNEIFTSTTLNDAVFLSKKILDQIVQLDLLCVCVTFIDELASLEKTVSMVSTVVPENPTLRTYKILRKPADGLAYAISIAEKYRLIYDHLKERLNHEGFSHVSRS
jgi:DNA mismatch repair ATPase MutS